LRSNEWRIADIYTEGDAIQWMWYAPHDVPGLLALFPDANTYVAALQVTAQSKTQIK
jgi:putative alpha-1,2-mannosidase